MTPSKTYGVLKQYRERVLQAFPKAKPERMDVTMPGAWSAHDIRCANHLLYMCDEAAKFTQSDERMEKAFRWLGFLQGVFAVWGIYSIDEMGKHNMPDPVDAP